MLLIWRRGPGWVLAGLALVSLGLAEWMLDRDSGAAFFLLPFRAWELLAGACAALYLSHRAQPIPLPLPSDGLAGLGLALIAIAVTSQHGETRFPGVAALPPVIGTVLVILFARDGGWVCRVLGAWPLVRVGLMSYGLYLWHQPVFALVTHRFGPVAFAENAGWLILLSFGLAMIGHRLVEEPFPRRVSIRALSISLVTSVGVVIALGLAVHDRADDHPNSVPSYSWALKHADEDLLRYAMREDVQMTCSAEDALGVQSCGFGDPEAEVTLVLWDDSLAGALLHGMDRMARDKGLGAGTYFQWLPTDPRLVQFPCPDLLGSNA